MKAMILAAGLGSRLRPHTLHTPKPLFPVGTKPLIELIIERLIAAGCRSVIINTHHLGEMIADRLGKQKFPITVTVCHEPKILGTGGALKNVIWFWSNQPLLVVNADIYTDLDLADLYQFHCQHSFPVTMALHHCNSSNNVLVDKDSMVTGFLPAHGKSSHASGTELLAYTGIQVIDPEVANLMEAGVPADIVSVYRQGLKKGLKIKALRVDGTIWHDIGTCHGYRQAVINHLAPDAFTQFHGRFNQDSFDCRPLAGDGSDRQWFRLFSGTETMIVVDHGIRPATGPVEADAFVSIGRHLASESIPVPEIILYHQFSGIVFVQDLGDTNLQSAAKSAGPEKVLRLYQKAIRVWARMAIAGSTNFDPRWCWQTPHYDQNVIIENECRYFLKAFIKDSLGLNCQQPKIEADFHYLADRLMHYALPGLVHRDFQSRNIMLTGQGPALIDFQGARLGPIQYDLAALLIDPYTGLEPELVRQLLRYAIKVLSEWITFDPNFFLEGFNLCAVSRNLQILGAFAYLSNVKGKSGFRQYIPAATSTLLNSLRALEGPKRLPALWQISRQAAEICLKHGQQYHPAH